MKLLKLICLSGLLMAYQKSTAQYTLTDGAQLELNVVNEPLFYWDMMRLQFPSFTRQARPNENQPYYNSNQMLQTKDETGRFSLLQTGVYDLSLNDWIVLDKHVYTRNYEANFKLINEVIETYKRADMNPNTPLKYERCVATNYYDADIVRERTELTKDADNQFISSFVFKTDYLNGLRLRDTIINGESKTVNHYSYDNQNRCVMIKTTPSFNTDSVINHVLFSYNQNQLEGIHVMYKNDTSFSKRYTYDNNKLAEVRIMTQDENGYLRKGNLYKHSYRPDGKLQWTASFFSVNNVWLKSDSMYFNYINNTIDTGYGYTSISNQWKTYPNYRFIFEKPTVGLSNPKLALNFSVFPNPTTDNLTIELEDKLMIESVELIDLMGRVALHRTNLQNNNINVADLNSGVYMLRVTTSKGTGQKKIVIN